MYVRANTAIIDELKKHYYVWKTNNYILSNFAKKNTTAATTPEILKSIKKFTHLRSN